MPATRLLPCSPDLAAQLAEQVRQVAHFWAGHPGRPRLAADAVSYWGRLIQSWATDSSLPLLVRKSERGVARGELVVHPSGRALVPTDNSPANWVYMQAAADRRPTLADLAAALEADTIPVTMVVDPDTKARALYRCARSQEASPNSSGWKVCHKVPVALAGRGRLAGRSLADLQRHFINFMSPGNLFLVPLDFAGLGELDAFIQAVQDDERSR